MGNGSSLNMQQLNEQLTKGKFQTVIYMYFISLIYAMIKRYSNETNHEAFYLLDKIATQIIILSSIQGFTKPLIITSSCRKKGKIIICLHAVFNQNELVTEFIHLIQLNQGKYLLKDLIVTCSSTTSYMSTMWSN